jgi:hypothetical protein
MLSREQPTSVKVRDLKASAHSVTSNVAAESVVRSAAVALAGFNQESWAVESLTPNAALTIESIPANRARNAAEGSQNWLGSPSASPREMMTKRKSQT